MILAVIKLYSARDRVRSNEVKKLKIRKFSNNDKLKTKSKAKDLL